MRCARLVRAGIAESRHAPRTRPPPPPPPDGPRLTLTAEQHAAADALSDAVRGGETASFLLHGVTGSGKTEVFLTAVEETLAAGRDVLILVPEIALTHQLVARVRDRFGDLVAVLHSGLGPRERWDEWRRIRSRAARVVVGARSAVFAPLACPGLLVVDEEHDAAYKQEDGIRYNARDLAVVRARLARAVVVLASATPSAETHHAAREGRHRLLLLTSRPTPQPLPVVELVDLRARDRPRSGETLLSPEVRTALETNLAAGGQTLVFLNRRGFATYLQCPGVRGDGELSRVQRDPHLAPPRRRARLPPLSLPLPPAGPVRGMRRTRAGGVRRRHRADRVHAAGMLPCRHRGPHGSRRGPASRARSAASCATGTRVTPTSSSARRW